MMPELVSKMKAMEYCRQHKSRPANMEDLISAARDGMNALLGCLADGDILIWFDNELGDSEDECVVLELSPDGQGQLSKASCRSKLPVLCVRA